MGLELTVLWVFSLVLEPLYQTGSQIQIRSLDLKITRKLQLVQKVAHVSQLYLDFYFYHQVQFNVLVLNVPSRHGLAASHIQDHVSQLELP